MIPSEYRGREQTYLKHRVLLEYLASWAQKIASTVRQGQSIKLWYVDCFAGPWKARDEKLDDTSVAIGLNVKEVWKLHAQSKLVLQNIQKGQRTTRDENILSLR